MTAPHDLPAAGPGAPTPPIALRDGGAAATRAGLDADVDGARRRAGRLAAICPTASTATRSARPAATGGPWP